MADERNHGITRRAQGKETPAQKKCPSSEPTAGQRDHFKQPNASDAEVWTLTVEEHLAGLWKVLGLAG